MACRGMEVPDKRIFLHLDADTITLVEHESLKRSQPSVGEFPGATHIPAGRILIELARRWVDGEQQAWNNALGIESNSCVDTNRKGKRRRHLCNTGRHRSLFNFRT